MLLLVKRIAIMDKSFASKSLSNQATNSMSRVQEEKSNTAVKKENGHFQWLVDFYYYGRFQREERISTAKNTKQLAKEWCISKRHSSNESPERPSLCGKKFTTNRRSELTLSTSNIPTLPPPAKKTTRGFRGTFSRNTLHPASASKRKKLAIRTKANFKMQSQSENELSNRPVYVKLPKFKLPKTTKTCKMTEESIKVNYRVSLPALSEAKSKANDGARLCHSFSDDSKQSSVDGCVIKRLTDSFCRNKNMSRSWHGEGSMKEVCDAINRSSTSNQEPFSSFPSSTNEVASCATYNITRNILPSLKCPMFESYVKPLKTERKPSTNIDINKCINNTDGNSDTKESSFSESSYFTADESELKTTATGETQVTQGNSQKKKKKYRKKTPRLSMISEISEQLPSLHCKERKYIEEAKDKYYALYCDNSIKLSRKNQASNENSDVENPPRFSLPPLPGKHAINCRNKRSFNQRYNRKNKYDCYKLLPDTSISKLSTSSQEYLMQCDNNNLNFGNFKRKKRHRPKDQIDISEEMQSSSMPNIDNVRVRRKKLRKKKRDQVPASFTSFGFEGDDEREDEVEEKDSSLCQDKLSNYLDH